MTDKLHEWYDATREPDRFIIFMGILGLPLTFIGAWTTVAESGMPFLVWVLVSLIIIADRRRFLRSRREK